MKKAAVAVAPTKCIITGEHFVVHGARALAAAVGRYVTVEVTESPWRRVSSDRVGTAEGLAPLGRVLDAIADTYALKHDFSVSVSSDVPHGAGLGSSAATMVAVAEAVSRLESLRFTKKETVAYAMIGESAVHGRPSGIDVNVCAYGGVMLFRMGETPRAVKLKGGRSLILVYSGTQRSTKVQIDKVAAAKSRRPGFFKALTVAVDEVSGLAAQRLVDGDLDGLGRLMNINHAMLQSVGASSEQVNGIVDELLAAGCLGAKLTGAGGGGNVLGLTPKGREKEIITRLRERGFEAFEARLPVGGVKSWLKR
ncbi:MAG TPA: mevalonate kinase [Nitrososphaerales archaeon]|nr:mevalonate kinase [Nitrososphaerales archaeon]